MKKIELANGYVIPEIFEPVEWHEELVEDNEAHGRWLVENEKAIRQLAFTQNPVPPWNTLQIGSKLKPGVHNLFDIHVDCLDALDAEISMLRAQLKELVDRRSKIEVMQTWSMKPGEWKFWRRDILNNWVAALRSGQYKRSRYHLKEIKNEETFYDAYGVLLEINNYYSWGKLKEDGTPADDWKLSYVDNPIVLNMVWQLNAYLDFNEIADWIERNL